MLFWLGIIAFIVAALFGLNGVEWFDGEDNLVAPLAAIGVGLIALWAFFTALALIAVNRARKSTGRYFRDF